MSLSNTVRLSCFALLLLTIPCARAQDESLRKAIARLSPAAQKMFSEGVAVGAPAPDFKLKRLAPADTSNPNQESTLQLSEFLGKRPVVLVFGSYTCPPFRRALEGDLGKLYEHYKDHAQFLFVYIREAHPKEYWSMAVNGKEYPDPKTFAERRTMADTCVEALKVGMPTLVDEVDDGVGLVYGAMPNRVYLIDAAGHVSYRSTPGPMGYRPREVETLLRKLISASTTLAPVLN